MMNLTRKAVVGGLLFSLMGSFASCGYSTRSALPGTLRTIHVEQFKNKIDFTNENRRNVYFPLMEVTAHNAVVERLQFDGNLRVTAREKADLVLKGELIAYERQPIRYDENENVEEYRVQVVLNLVLFNTQLGEDMWTENGFVGEATYFPTGPLAKTEETAVSLAMEDLGRRVVERIVEDW